jgi:hypothetical protein
MATKSLSYDHPQYLVRQVATVNLPAIAASKSAGKFIAFAAMKVKNIRCIINIAGTSTGAYTLSKNGTASFANVPTLTSTALATVAPSVTTCDLSAGEFIDFQTNDAGATLAATFLVEYDLIPGAAFTE